MTIRRQYSLPNCKLVLEGWEDTTGVTQPSDGRPLLSMVTNMECHFAGHEQPLTGGQELLDGLIYTVSCYVQEVLSGIRRPSPSATKSVARVQLQAVEGDVHRLTVNQAANETDPSKYQVDLKTIQLFDLVEAMDQLVADVSTLPQLAVDLAPLPKRYVAAQEPVTEKLLPAAIGVSTLAAAAIALFLLPVPEVTRPEIETRPVTEEQQDGQLGDTSSSGLDTDRGDGSSNDSLEPVTGADANDVASDVSDRDADGTASESDRLPAESDPPEDASSDNTASGVATTGDTVSETSEVTSFSNDSDSGPSSPVKIDEDAQLPDAEEIDTILGNAQLISDPDQLTELTRILRDRVDQVWQRPEFLDADLVYRVGVSADGDLVGYKAVNDAAQDAGDKNPLREINRVPISVEESAQTSVGQFRVVFRTTGVVEVSPWYGRLPDD